MKYPHIQQHDEKDCGAACLSMISDFYGLKLPIAKFRDLIKVDNQGANIYGVVVGSKKIGFDAEALEGTSEELFEEISNGHITLPFIARIVNDEMFEHFIVMYGIKNDKLIIGDPGKPHITKMSVEKFIEQWQGQIITFVPNESFQKGNYRKGGLRRYFKFITKQKKMLAVIFVVSIIISLISIFSSQMFEYILDDAMVMTAPSAEHMEIPEAECDDENCDEHDHDDSSQELMGQLLEKLSIIFANLDTVCISIILLFVLRGLLQALRGYMLSITAKRVEIPLTLQYYNHLIDLPAEFYGTRKTGELMSRFSDTSRIREVISTTALTIMIDTIMAILTGIYLFKISHLLFAITIIIILIYALIVFAFRRPIKSISHEIMENDAQVDSYLKESIEGIETVKAYQYEESAKYKTKKLFVRLINKIVKGSVIEIVQEILVATVASVGVVFLLWSGTYLCIQDILTIGELISFYYLLSYFLDPVKNLIDLQTELQTAAVAAERLNDVLDAELENNNGKKEITSLLADIKLENIYFRYGNREQVLKNVSMNIGKGKKVAIVGESGCGKTTLTKLLMMFYKPEKGTITIGNIDLSEYNPQSIRKHIAYISQNVFFFSDTIYNNLRMGNEKITNKEIQKICKLCYADDFIQNLPLGYDTPLDENGNNLSGGQKQRLAIARALLRNPDILIMDEATSNLDSLTEESIEKTINKLSENITCIVIAHRLKTIKNCDYIYVMYKGKIIEEGTHEELINKNGIYQQYLNT